LLSRSPKVSSPSSRSRIGRLHAIAAATRVTALTRHRIVELTHVHTPHSNERTVDVLVARLRRKLGDEPRHPRIILTVRALGYQLGTRRVGWTDRSRWSRHARISLNPEGCLR
jgi:hypothetical protein